MIKTATHHTDNIQVDPAFSAWIELIRSHAYISSVIFQEKISDLQDVKNPLMIQEIFLDLWGDQLNNQANFLNGLSNIGMLFFRRYSLMPCGILEEEAYGILS